MPATETLEGLHLNDPASAAPLLRLDGAVRHRERTRVLDGVTLEVRVGEVAALLGLNGAGKSTLLALAAGALSADAGTVRVAGTDPRRDTARARALIGWLPDPVPLYPELTVGEQVDTAAALSGVAKRLRQSAVARALERLDLGALAPRLCGQLSRGMAQRVGIAQAIVHAPTLLLLDEPTAGLDPVQHARFNALLGELKADMGIVHATHQLGELGAATDRVVILHRGQLRYAANRDTLRTPGALAQAFMDHVLAATQSTPERAA